jgi:predicted dehydrogenase
LGELRLGIIGCGSIAKKHLKAIARNRRDFVIKAVSDISLENALGFRNAYTGLTGERDSIDVYTDYRVMIEKEELDMVSILTESGKHYYIAMDCIEQGINILVEKPLALSLENVDNLIAAAAAKKVKLGVVHQYRFNPLVSLLKGEIDAGSFNEIFYGVTTVRWNRNKDYYKNAGWRGTKDMDGGILMNQCIHNIDLLQWLLGQEVAEVFAYGQNYSHPYIDTEDTVFALIKFGKEVMGIFEGTVCTYPCNLEGSIAVFGERGSVKIGGACLNEIETWVFDKKDAGGCLTSRLGDIAKGYEQSSCHEEVYRDFANAVNCGREPMVNGEEARKSIEIILAIQRSAQTGLPVKLPLEGGL